MKTSTEINDIARTLASTISALELTRCELVMVLGLVEARIMNMVYKGVATGSAPPAPVVVDKAEVVEKESVPVVKKTVQYDPLYDPPPPMNAEEPPARETGTGKVLAPVNKACVCSVCNKVVYITNKEIKDGCKIPEFIEAFTPTDGMPPLSRKSEIQNIDGNISTDCPSCNASKSLYLIGSGSAKTGVSI